MKTNITVVTHNRLALTKICLRSLLEKTIGEYAVTVVDNCSKDGTREYLAQLSKNDPRVHVYYLRSNMGVAVAANFGWAQVDADYYVKLDNDIEICDGNWLEHLVSLAENNANIGMASYLLANWDCTKEGICLADSRQFVSSDLCNGGCVLIPRHVHEKLGFWIEDHGKYGYEDKEFSDRARAAGYLIGYLPVEPAPVVHLGFVEGQVDNHREQEKKINTVDKQRGEPLYVFNKLLFDKGIRKRYVERRYLPEEVNGTIRFKVNPAYLPIVKIQEQFLEKIQYQGTDEGIAVMLSELLP